MKICIDCKFFEHGFLGENGGFCIRRRTSTVVPNLIRGGTRLVDTTPRGLLFLTATEERESILPWKCGAKARYFQPEVPA